MNDKVKEFIEDNIELIESNRWKEVYDKIIPTGFTDALLEAQINPAELLGYIPKRYLQDSRITQYSIPDNITNIGGAAFSDCENLTTINIPSSVKSIDDYGFYNCNNLTDIKLNSGLISIGDFAFRDCQKLSKVVLPDTVEYIG